MDKEKSSEAIQAFRRYSQAFQSLDTRAVAQCFDEPAFAITPNGIEALPTRAAVEQAYARVFATLPERDYARTELSSLSERRLGDDLSIVSGSGVWKNASGGELMRFGMTYTLRRTGQTWRILVAIVHA